jgi:hypothetical protein
VTGLAEYFLLAGNGIKQNFPLYMYEAPLKRNPVLHTNFWAMQYNSFFSLNIPERKELFNLVAWFHTSVTLCQKFRTML